MATKVLMEALSPTMEEGRLLEWKKQEGDPVAVGEVLAEVETDKAVMDLQARAAGVLLKQVIAAGTTIPVGQLVGVIGAAGEDISGLLPGGSPDRRTGRPAPAAGPPSPPRPESSAGATGGVSVGREGAQARPAGVKVVVEPPSRRVAEPRVKASPLARKIAVDRGLDLARIHGSGPEGRIVAKDLDIPAAATMVRAAELPSRRAAEPFSDVPLSQVRKTIAKRLVQSIGPIPTFYLTTEVDMERVAEAREALNESARRLGDRAPLGSAPARPGREGVPQGGSAAGDEPVKVSFNDIIIKATALALLAHPACNAWWQEDRIRYWNEVHISVAVAIEDGLITPVVRNADRKSLRELAGEVRDLVARARERRLQPEEYTGGTFSISNLGMFDIDEFTAVINPPEAGILAIGSVAPRPVVEREGVVVRRRMRITMSCDHRVIDGATGAAFLRTLKQMLENPLALVW